MGISNFVTFLENTKGYRQDLRRAEYGDERDPEMRAFLERIAPTVARSGTCWLRTRATAFVKKANVDYLTDVEVLFLEEHLLAGLGTRVR